jgi:hypothetical protein
MRSILVEAKPTETDFQSALARMVTRYRDFTEVITPTDLIKSADVVRACQLVHGVLAAHESGGSFCVSYDARRPDLIESWYAVMRSVRSCVLRCRLQLLTSQEIAALLPSPAEVSCTQVRDYRRFLEWDARAISASHYLTVPFLTKKCDLHPLLRQTEGEIVMVPSLSSRRDHRGESCSRRERWITSPQPQGHISAASQGVPSPTAYRTWGFSRSGISSVKTARYFGGRR